MIRSTFSTEVNTALAIDNVLNELDSLSDEIALTILFISPSHNLEIIEKKISSISRNKIVACTSSGEISTSGNLSHGITGMSFCSSEFKASNVPIGDLTGFTAALAQENFVGVHERILKHEKAMGEGAKSFGILLIDGLSMKEEKCCGILGSLLGDTPLIGGSAGDNLGFKITKVLHNGKFEEDAASLTFITTTRPFKVFKNQHFKRTEQKLIITESDVEKRVVSEINGEPASIAYANMLGVDVKDFSPSVFSRYPLMLRMGDENYVRSIQKSNDDNTLTFYCAIDIGLVLTLADKEDLYLSNEKIFQSFESELEGIDSCLLFECILRRLEYDDLGKNEQKKIDELYQKYQCTGFHTYGEQYGNVHINQTLTGVVFGKSK